MENLKNALNAWQNLLGSENVITDNTTLLNTQAATFATKQEIPAIIRPSNSNEVQECLRIANQYKTPVYPVSRGKNWGYGSQVPVQDCVIIDLGKLNRIIELNEDLAYVTVEPGVTQQQLFEYLRDKKSNLFMSVTGGPPDASLVGNALERGIGKGPYGDKFSHVCGFEVILPTGECIHTGLERFANAKAAKVHRWGVGPYLDGLFTQSNLGIVTQMTMWLSPIPKYFQTFYYSLKDDSKLGDLIDTLRYLKLIGLIKGTFVIGNDYRILSITQPYPWKEADGKIPFPSDVMRKLKRPLGGSMWFGEGALYSASRKLGLEERKLIKRALKNKVDSIVFFDDRNSRVAKFIAPFYKWFTGIEVNVDGLYYNNLHRGIPSDFPVSMAYWKKQLPVPANKNPNKDRCGLIWCAPAIPFEGECVKEALKIIEETMISHQFEFNVGLNCFSERCLDITISFIYDRELAGEDERAMTSYQSLLDKLIQAGYIPYRLGIQSMNALPPVKDDYGKLLGDIKNTLDPNGILAPGRYELGAIRLIINSAT